MKCQAIVKFSTGDNLHEISGPSKKMSVILLCETVHIKCQALVRKISHLL